MVLSKKVNRGEILMMDSIKTVSSMKSSRRRVLINARLNLKMADVLLGACLTCRYSAFALGVRIAAIESLRLRISTLEQLILAWGIV